MGSNLSTAGDAVTKGKMEAAKKEVKSGTRLYVINSVRGHTSYKTVVTVIDADTYQVITTIDVGDRADQLILNSAGTRLYVTSLGKWSWQGEKYCQGQGQIFVIDTNKDKVIAKFDVDLNPVALVLNSEGNRLYVANGKSYTVSIINIDTKTDTLKVEATIRVGCYSSDLILNSEENQLYVASGQSRIVSVIDIATHQVIAIRVGQTSVALVLNSAETQLYVANFDDNTISVIDTDTHQATTICAVKNPRQLILNSAENCLYIISRDLYCNNPASGEVILINPVTYQKIATISMRIGDETGTFPVALVLNAANTRLYVVNKYSHNILVIDTRTNQVIAIIDIEKFPSAIAIREGSVIEDETRFRSLSCNVNA
jgi:YVTN family beta-propeller protein